MAKKSDKQEDFLKDEFIQYLKKFNIEVKNINYYVQALTHGSCYPQSDEKNYQTLEFLGDAIIQFLMSDFIYHKYLNMQQGKLTLVRSKLVRTETLNNLSEKIRLKKFLLTGFKSQRGSILSSQKVGADIFESLVAAIYLDLGINKAKEFLQRTLFIEANEI
ncbi:ribonuclease III domain-containing protein [Mycoplasmopsis felifaucium]|uniref:ribonuclease III domain-containing protein n=1 Tax=Mycoplasmopsis felifaucium TaxID=35768 RepID=UPI000AB37409|nr:ribonuclease III domain-containing protein [Mycoplasmopsis felifaucium]